MGQGFGVFLKKEMQSVLGASNPLLGIPVSGGTSETGPRASAS
jgi:hypothetical protein